MARFLGNPLVQYFKTGTVEYLAGGVLYAYDAGTMTPRYIYQTIDDALALTNGAYTATLDARGEAPVVTSGATKLILKDSLGNTIWTADDVDAASTDIVDANGNEILKFVGAALAVNEWTMTNAATGSGPSLAVTGGDTNAAGNITSKGSGALNLDGGTTGVVNIGTTSTGDINLKRNTAVTGTFSSSGQAIIGGTATNDDAAAGKQGEFLSSTLASGSAVSLAVTNTTYNVTSLSLTAGDWDIQWGINFSAPGTSISFIRGSPSLTSATLPASSHTTVGLSLQMLTATALTAHCLTGATCRQSLAATTTVYLVASMTFTGTAPTAHGWISARRAR